VTPVVPLVLGLAGVVVAVAGAVSLRRRAVDRRLGELVAIDAGRAATLRSSRYRLAGRPDVLLRAADGTLLPVELKHRPAPAAGPFPSHLVQLGAYCLLVEEATGRSPPFGVLRYTDREVRVAWDPGLRARVIGTLDHVRETYDGRAEPTPGKCRGCVWSDRCDASLATGGHRPRPVRRAT